MNETVYEHVFGNDTFTITAMERWSINMVRRLKEQHPNDVEIIHENEDGSLLARVPADWMKVKPKQKRNLTDEQRAEIRDRLKASRSV